MNKPSSPEENRVALRAQIVGLGDQTPRKSYFPLLQQQIVELKRSRAAEEEKSEALRIAIEKLQETRGKIEESEWRFRTLADFTTDMEYWVGPDNKMLYISPSCEILTGYSQEEFFENPDLLASIVHPDDRPSVAIHAEGPALEDVHAVDLRVMTRSGTVKWVAHVCRPIIGKDGQWLGRRGSNRDISERKVAEAKIQRLTNLYAALSHCNQAIVRCIDAADLFPAICHAAVHFGGMKVAWIGLLDEKSKQVRPVASCGHGIGCLDDLEVMVVDKSDGPSSDVGPTVAAIRDNRPVWCQDLSHDPRLQVWPEKMRSAGLRGAAALPLRQRGVPIGNLTLYTDSTNMFDDQARGLLVEMALDISFALDNFAREAERKRAEDALSVAEEQFRGLVEQSIAGIFIIQDGRFAYVNPRFADILGYDEPATLIGTDPSAMLVAPDTVTDDLRGLLAGEGPAGGHIVTAVRKDGTLVDLGLHGARASHAGRPAIIGLMQDISEKKRAEEQVRHYLGQLEIAFMDTVQVATKLSELRDPYTAGHERRVARIASAIARDLGWDDSRVKGVAVAGYLHDLGKITIPAEILTRPGALSEIERMMIRGHPQTSHDVLRGAAFPWPVAEIVLQHHERLDGSGYPRGLKGDEILPDARILAVADVVEAMASHRPYRPGLGIDRALAEIEDGCGKIYDPEVAESCLRLFREKGFTVLESVG